MVLKNTSLVEVFMVVEKGDLKKLKTILNDKTEKNPVLAEDGSTVIHEAAKHGHLDIIKWYAEELHYSELNLEDNDGNTPFSQAIKEGKHDVVDYFIELGYGHNATSKIVFYNV